LNGGLKIGEFNLVKSWEVAQLRLAAILPCHLYGEAKESCSSSRSYTERHQSTGEEGWSRRRREGDEELNQSLLWQPFPDHIQTGPP